MGTYIRGPHVCVIEKPAPFTVSFAQKHQGACLSTLTEGQRWTGSSKWTQVLLFFQIALFYLLEEHLNKY